MNAILHQLRNQLGSVRDVYIAPDRVPARYDFQPQDEVVLLLHGFFQTRNVWEVMEDRLRFDGFKVLSFNFKNRFSRHNIQPVDMLARLVADKVQRAQEKYGFSKIHVMGHSKGGLIARRYVQDYGGAEVAKSVITLGTPHYGTPIAWLGIGLTGLLTSSARDMIPGSQLIEGLNLRRFPQGLPMTSIYSRSDLLCPAWCAKLRPRTPEQLWFNVEVPRVGHCELTWDLRVYHSVKNALENATTRCQQPVEPT